MLLIENEVNSVINTNNKGNAWWMFNFPFNKLNEPVFVLTCDNITNIDFSLIEKDYKKRESRMFFGTSKTNKKFRG